MSAPLSPTLQTITQSGDGVVIATWSPAGTGDPATSYTIFYKPESSPTWDLSATTISTSTTIVGLTPDLSYSFAVSATNVSGTSANSNTLTLRIVPRANAPTITSAQQVAVEVATIAFTPALTGEAATSYTIYWKLAADPAWTGSVVTAASPIDISGLATGSYLVAATATNSVGESIESTSTAFTIENNAPLPPTITAIEMSDASVHLSASPDLSGGLPTTYTYYMKLSTDSSWTQTDADISASAFTSQNTYDFAATATNFVGTSAPSASTQIFYFTQADIPAITTIVGRNAAIDVSWSAVATPPSTYVVRWNVVGSSTDLSLATAATTATIPDLSNGYEYVVAVSAIIGGNQTPADISNVVPYLPAYSYVNDIARDSSGIYTTGEATGVYDVSGAPVYDGPYITSSDPDTGAVIWSTTYASEYRNDVLICADNLLVGIDQSGQRINSFSKDNGTPGWTYSAAPNPTELHYDISGHIHIVGRFTGTFTPGGAAAPITTATNDAYLLTLDLSGIPISAFNITSTLHGPAQSLTIYPTAVSVSPDHTTYVGGIYTGVGTDISATEPYNASFIMAINDAGVISWIRSIDAQFLDDLNDIEYRDDRIYICGSYHNRSRYLDLDQVISLPSSPDSAGEGYVAALDTTGAYLWALKIGCDISSNRIDQEQSLIQGITIDQSGVVFFTGNFVDNPLILDVSGAPVELQYQNAGGRNAFFGAMAVTPAEPLPPLPPIDISATSPELNQIRVSWQPATTGGPARSFKVFYKHAGDGIFENFVNTEDLSYTFVSLPTRQYTFAVVAVGPGGISTNSAEVSLTPSSLSPAPPALVTAIPENQVLDISWNASFDAVSYNIYIRPNGQATWDLSYSPIYGTRAVIGDLSNSILYDIAVAAVNIRGEGALSTPIQAQPTFIVPRTPTDLSAVTGDNTITLTWNVVDTNPTSFNVYYKVASSPGAYDVSSVLFPNVTFTGIFVNGQTYSIYVTAVSPVGESDPTPSINVTPAIPVPAAPVIIAVPGDEVAIISWTDVSYANTYSIYQSTDISGTFVAANPPTAAQGENPVLVTDLSNTIQYFFKVTATGVSGTSLDSNIAEATPVAPIPAVPIPQLLVVTTPTSVRFTWLPAENADSYVVYWRDISGPSMPSNWDISAATAATEIVVEDLINQHTYEFAVQSSGRGGVSALSSVRSIYLPPKPPAPDVSASAVGTTIVVNWIQDISALYYTYYQRSQGASTWAVEETISADISSITRQVGYGEAYEVSLGITTPNGMSDPATPIPLNFPYPVPAAPTLNGVAGDGVLDLSWNAAVYSFSYVVNATGLASGPAGQVQDISFLTTETRVSVPAINGGEYLVSVTANGETGTSQPSSPLVLMPLPPLPVAPTGLAAARRDGAVDLSWSAVERADSYVIYWGADSSLNVGSVLATSVTGLVNATTYTFQVAAANYAGVGARSTGVQATPRALPGVVADLSAVAGDGIVDLTWGAASNATKYEIYLSSAGRPFELVGDVAQTFVTINALMNCIFYEFKVIPVNVDYAGPESSPVTAFPISPSPSAVPVVEVPIDTKIAVANTFLPTAEASPEDTANFNAYLDDILARNTSEVIVDPSLNLVVGVFSMEDLAARKAILPEGTPFLADSRANILDIAAPSGTAITILNFLQVGESTINMGNVSSDVVIDLRRYDVSKAQLTSTLSDSSTYTLLEFERDSSYVNVYRSVEGIPILMLTLGPEDTGGKTGLYDCSGVYLGEQESGKFRFRYFGPFSYTILTSPNPGQATPCLVGGTRLAVPGGWKIVDELRAGDVVVTDDGRRVKVKEVYMTRLEAATADTAPVVIPKSFGLQRELVISKCHAVKLRGGWLIPHVAEARAGKQIFERRGVGSPVSYYHVEMPEYLRDNLVVDGGAVVESFGRPWAAKQGRETLRGLWRVNKKGLLERMEYKAAATLTSNKR